MSSGSYFTHLLGVDVEESQDLSPTTHTPPDHGLAASKGSQGRTKNFKDEEDRLLVSAWLNVGMDPIQGVAQPQSSFWSRIHDYYHANKSFQLDRTQGSLMHRWSAIQHDVNIFCSCVIKIQNRNQSGCSVDDKIASACALFKEEDKKHRNFAFMHCWRILKDKPKWIERCMQNSGTTTYSNKKQKTKFAAATAQDASKRPDGKKTEKKKLHQRSTIEALDYLVAKMKEADA
ncbi:glutathione S-transferase T3-like [Panicum hallii]|uniref:glutathione S-transferase T3-like n=1 Tax=Panicum hallii TaxID=206008 RepID=UPI000DF4E9F3|nr:glutathione S-transferase T3-like [Panicum hallii]